MRSLDRNTYPLHDAVQRVDVDEVVRLLEMGTNPNSFDDLGMTPLVWAVYGGYVQIVEVLCCAGADVDLRTWSGETALWHAEDGFGLYEIGAVLRQYGATAK
jgi:ankyrin repeat protein